MAEPWKDKTGTSTVLRRIREDGGPQAWEGFVLRYWRVIHGYAHASGLPASECEDLTQTVLTELVGMLPEFEVDHSVGSFRALLRTIVRRRVIDLRRKQGRESVAVIQRSQAESVNGNETTDELFDRVWREGLLKSAMAEVAARTPAEAFQAFELSSQAKMPANEIAKLLDMSVNSVYQHKSRVARDIRETFERLDAEAN
jgi:RNA polymerase sigma factor (sigma-70 family)